MIIYTDKVLNHKKRLENEKKFSHYEQLPDGTRKYWFELTGRLGWKARYVKTVDKDETTIAFRQEVYDEKDNLVEIHEKFPQDKGHKKV